MNVLIELMELAEFHGRYEIPPEFQARMPSSILLLNLESAKVMLLIPSDLQDLKPPFLESFLEVGNLFLLREGRLVPDTILQEDGEQGSGVSSVLNSLKEIMVEENLLEKEAQLPIRYLLTCPLNHHLTLGNGPVH